MIEIGQSSYHLSTKNDAEIEKAAIQPEILAKTEVPVSAMPPRPSEPRPSESAQPEQSPIAVPIRRSLPLTKSQRKKKKEKEKRKAEKERIEPKKGIDVFLSTPKEIVEAVKGHLAPKADAELNLGTKRSREADDDNNSARLAADLERDRQKAVQLINAARSGLMATNDTSKNASPEISKSANGTPPHSPFIHTVTKIMRLALLQMAVDHDAAAFAAWIAAFPEIDDRLHIFGAEEIRSILRSENPGTNSARSRNVAMNQMSVSAGASSADPLSSVRSSSCR